MLAELLFEDMIFSVAGFRGPIWEAREVLEPKKRERVVEDEEVEVLLHFMFLKKAMEEMLVSILVDVCVFVVVVVCWRLCVWNGRVEDDDKQTRRGT